MKTRIMWGFKVAKTGEPILGLHKTREGQRKAMRKFVVHGMILPCKMRVEVL